MAWVYICREYTTLQSAAQRGDNPVVWSEIQEGRLRVDEEIDFHGFTRNEMLSWLEDNWSRRRWHGRRRVRVIHGKGDVLPGALKAWCDDKGIPWAPESGNPGSTILRPASRSGHASQVPNKPLASIKNRVIPCRPPGSEPAPDPGDTELFENCVAEIAESERRSLRRRKHD